MNISHKNLRAFVQVAKSTTFADAASRLHLTQPALSSAIKKMESELGGKLFSRSTRRVELTPEGQSLLPNAIRLLQDWEDTFNDIQNLFSMEQGKLHIAAMPSFAESKLPNLLKNYNTRHPNIRLRIFDVVMERAVETVLDGGAEVGFTFEPQRKEGLDFLPLFDDAFVVIVNAEHPLAHNSNVSWRDCLQHPFVIMNRGSAVRQWTDEHLSQYGEPRIVAETGQLGTLGQLIVQGLGIAVMPSLCVPNMKKLGLVSLTINDDPLIKSVGMIKLAHRELSVAAQSLWEYAKQKHR